MSPCCVSLFLFFLMIPPPPRSTLFPYTTLFRSRSTIRPSRSRSSFPTRRAAWPTSRRDRKSTRLNSSHRTTSYAVFCLKKKKLDNAYTEERKEAQVTAGTREEKHRPGKPPVAVLRTSDTIASYVQCRPVFVFFFKDTATTEIYTLSLHDALPICERCRNAGIPDDIGYRSKWQIALDQLIRRSEEHTSELQSPYDLVCRLLLE